MNRKLLISLIIAALVVSLGLPIYESITEQIDKDATRFERMNPYTGELIDE